MPDPTDWPEIRRTMRQPTHTSMPPRRSSRLLLIIFVVLIILGFASRSWLSYYVDALWFGSLGYGQVFWKSLRLQSSVFCIFTVATFLVLYGTFLVLRRTHPDAFADQQTIWLGDHPVRFPVGRILRLIALVVSLVIGVGTGAVMLVEWPVFALYWYSPHAQTGLVDPVFAKPLNFYFFTIPAWELIAGWLMVMAVLTCAASALFIVASRGKSALDGPTRSYRPTSWSGFSIAFAFLLLVVALQVYLDRFERLFEEHTIFSGVTYTDAHVMLPGLLVVCVRACSRRRDRNRECGLNAAWPLAGCSDGSSRGLLYRAAGNCMVRRQLYREAEPTGSRTAIYCGQYQAHPASVRSRGNIAARVSCGDKCRSSGRGK